MRYALLLNPGHNRVYFDASKRLSVSELSIVSHSMSVPVTDICIEDIAGISYITFEASSLSDEDISLVSRLSFVYAIFSIEEISGCMCFTPITRDSFFIGDDISMMLKYSGKTNELFTRMMINIGLHSGAFGKEKNISLLDPVAGKGTTLFEGLMQGCSVYGIEVSSSVAHETVVFLKRYLEQNKLKHTVDKRRTSGPDRSFSYDVSRFMIARSKHEQKQGEERICEVAAGDCRNIAGLYRKNTFHAVVGDLPYGVQHGNVSAQGKGTRNPSMLLRESLPGIYTVLKPGGTVTLSWNTFLLPRAQLERAFNEAGLSVLGGELFEGIEHRVDQAINRDVIVGIKK